MADANDIRVFDPIGEDSWDAQTASHPRASFFHCAKWARVLRATYGHVPHYLAVMKGDQPQALLPILEVNSPLTGRRGVSLPFSDECNVLSFDGFEANDLIRYALELGRKRRWKHFELRGNLSSEWKVTPWISYLGHKVDLSGGAESVFARLDGRVRNAVRKAEKSNVEAQVAITLEAVRTFYELHCLTRRKHGVPPQSFTFFRSLFDHVLQEDGGFIVTARLHNTPVAAGVFVHHGRTGIYKFGASDPSCSHLRGNDLVVWEAMKWYASRGYSWFSMGRTAKSNEGLRHFKCGFGAREYPINYFRYDLRREAFVVGHDEQGGWINGLFRLTPMTVFRMIGRMSYPHID